ncbi:hypothetical protein [Deinococcus cellulosilyticus]|uniref:hypothetical protein n=1 Tax=Deinococcus cellulosilyticus TaxID=401558 RepID=UPI0011BFE3DF|nr:hypothetical protein [Deinococcus cellulosilyticus]
MGTPQRSSNAQRIVSALCNVLVWGLVLWWYSIELPKWVGFVRKAGQNLSPELQSMLFLHPYAGWLLGIIMLLFSFLAARGRNARAFANIQVCSALVAALAVGWVMWGIYQSIKGAVGFPLLF